jgi:hypothetical protein
VCSVDRKEGQTRAPVSDFWHRPVGAVWEDLPYVYPQVLLLLAILLPSFLVCNQ